MSNDDNQSTSNNNRIIVPVDTDNNPIQFIDNPAHIDGALEEFRLFCERQGYYRAWAVAPANP